MLGFPSFLLRLESDAYYLPTFQDSSISLGSEGCDKIQLETSPESSSLFTVQGIYDYSIEPELLTSVEVQINSSSPEATLGLHEIEIMYHFENDPDDKLA